MVARISLRSSTARARSLSESRRMAWLAPAATLTVLVFKTSSVVAEECKESRADRPRRRCRRDTRIQRIQSRGLTLCDADDSGCERHLSRWCRGGGLRVEADSH